MSVITISRGSFSGGKMLAECLARQLGYRLVDRDVIVERAAAFGVSQDNLRDALEKPPGLLDRFIKHKRYLYLVLIQAALAEEVRSGKAIYHGLAGHLLLQGGPHLLRIRVIAPMEFRIRMVQQRLKFSRTEAVAYIEKMDEDRRKWTHFLYGVDWGDPALYDLVVNLEYLNIDQICNSVCSIVLGGKCFEFSAECQQRMDDQALASRVRANLAMNPSTADLEVEAGAKEGSVWIEGKLSSIAQLKEVERVAQSVPGVVALHLDKLSSPQRE